MGLLILALSDSQKIKKSNFYLYLVYEKKNIGNFRSNSIQKKTKHYNVYDR